MKKNNKTSWGRVSNWYNKHLKENDTYHEKVILPNLLRLIDLKSGKSLLEIGCGQGYFLEKFYQHGLSNKLTGIDIGKELIEIARKRNKKIKYIIANAEDQNIMLKEKFDIILFVLSIQNMKDLNSIAKNVNKFLKDNGKVYLVINHPCFRIPQHSEWINDDKKKVQSRKIDLYMSEKEIKIDMTPGSQTKKILTRSFHRPLQVYSKVFSKNNLAVTKIEEWISHKKSENGPRKSIEDNSRKEFPMFMCLELCKLIT